MQSQGKDYSAIFLIAANLIPLIGVLFFDWSAVLVLALFWTENLIIGGFNLLKIITNALVVKAPRSLLLAAFFFVHYGAFWSVHGQLLADLLSVEVPSNMIALGFSSSGPQEIFLDGLAVLVSFIDLLAPTIWLGVIALVLSHFVSFMENFILNGRIFKTSANRLMMAPYSQVLILHAGLMLGALAIQKFGSEVWLLGLIVFLKIIVDFVQFRRRHSNDHRHAHFINRS